MLTRGKQNSRSDGEGSLISDRVSPMQTTASLESIRNKVPLGPPDREIEEGNFGDRPVLIQSEPTVTGSPKLTPIFTMSSINSRVEEGIDLRLGGMTNRHEQDGMAERHTTQIERMNGVVTDPSFCISRCVARY